MIKSTVLLFLTLTSVHAFAPLPPPAQRLAKFKANPAPLLPTTRTLYALPDALDLPGAIDSVAAASASPPSVALWTVGVLAVVMAGLAFSNGSAVTEAPNKNNTVQEQEQSEPIDVSIPYDAAALLTYCQYKGVSSVVDQADYEAFQALYKEAAVAEVTLKKMQRDVDTFQETVQAKQKALSGTKMSP